MRRKSHQKTRDAKVLDAKVLAFMLLAMPAMAQTPEPAQAPSVPVAKMLAAAPHITIANGRLKAVVYPPGPGGFYQGTRFDQAGVIGSLVLGSQNYYGPWFDRVAPDVPDFKYRLDGIVTGPNSAIMGPAEEFSPAGFDTAKPGGGFLKIGVGILKKPDDKPYDHYRIYDIAQGGKRITRTTPDSVTMTQAVSDPASGFGYIYEKTIRLIPGTPHMQIEHSLKNIGTRRILTDVYNHNFVTMSPGNANLVVTLPFAPPADGRPELLAADGMQLRYVRPLVDQERAAFLLSDEKSPPHDYQLAVANSRTGASVTVTGDAPMTRLNLWSIRSVVAVEPYIAIDVPPGGEKRWTYTYSYTATR